MTSRTFKQVDVFTAEPYHGNPVAVVLDAERIGWGASSRNGGMVSGGLKVAGGALEALAAS